MFVSHNAPWSDWKKSSPWHMCHCHFLVTGFCFYSEKTMSSHLSRWWTWWYWKWEKSLSSEKQLHGCLAKCKPVFWISTIRTCQSQKSVYFKSAFWRILFIRMKSITKICCLSMVLFCRVAPRCVRLSQTRNYYFSA